MNKLVKSFIIGLLVVLAAQLVFTLEFTSDPVINDGMRPFLTSQDLVCSWSSIDNTSYAIKWYKSEGSSGFSYESTYDNNTVLSSSSTSLGNKWVCEVIITDGVNVSSMNSSAISILPWLSSSSGDDVNQLVPYGFSLNEDENYTFYVKSPDLTGSGSQLGVRDEDVCTIVDSSTGEILCIPRHEHVSSFGVDFGEEATAGYNVTLKEDLSDSSYYSNMNFTLIPVNDQAEFVTGIENQSLDALSAWSFELVGEDEELNYPLNFSLAYVDGLSSLLLLNKSDTTANLTFEHGQPTNGDVGNWSIIINLTDDGSSVKPPTSISFNLEIKRTNEPPYFTTDFSNISGIQNDSFVLEIEANDSDASDNLSFYVLRNDTVNPFCTSDVFPWNGSINMSDISASNASGIINISSLNNDHVVCRDVILSVQDTTEDSQSVPVFFNITNINDAPMIHEMSYFEENSFNQENISELIIGLYSTSASYKVNATDPDQLTYDVNNSGILSFSTNNSNFSIGSSTGILDLDFSDDALVGHWSVLITVEDNGVPSLNYSRIMNINITDNTPPVVTVPSNLTFNQTDNITIEFNVSDTLDDNVTIYFDSNNSRFNSSIYASSYQLLSFNESMTHNVTTWVINLSDWVEQQYESMPASARPPRNLYQNELVGTHNVSILVYDSFDAHDPSTSKANLQFNISNENDAPFFDTVILDNVSDGADVTFAPMVANKVFSRKFYFADFDLYLPSSIVNESLYFDVSASPNLTDVSFNKFDDNVATLSFIPQTTGSQFVTLGVSDSQGARENITINFEVFDETDPPQFLNVSPFFENNTTSLDFIDVANVTNPLDIEWIENSSLTFDADVYFVEDIGAGVDNYLDVEWFVNGESVEYLEKVEPTVNSSYSIYFDFFTDGVNNITMSAIDAVGSASNWTWAVDVENVNRPPIFCPASLDDIEVRGSRSMPNHLSYLEFQRFYDPDDDPENTGLVNIEPCNVSREFDLLPDLRALESLTFSFEYTTVACDADILFDGADLTITGHSVGMCRVIFNATDEEGRSVLSNEIEIEILEALEQEEVVIERQVTVTEQVQVPIEERVDVPTPTKIIYPGKLIFYQNKSVEVPIIIKNNWTEDFEDISFSASVLNASSVDELDNISITISHDNIDKLVEGDSFNISLSVSNYRVFEPLRVNIFANVSEPSFTDSETLIIAGLEMMGDDPQGARALVTYARDLLTSSPQCAELNDLLDEARTLLEQGSVDDAMLRVDAAVNGCKYLMSEDEIRRNEQPGALRLGLDFSSKYWSEIIFGAIAIILLAIVFYVVAYVKTSLKNKD